MGGLSPIHWIIVLGVAAVVFGGRGKLSSIMGDAAKGVRAFKDGLKGEDETHAAPTATAQIVSPTVTPTVVTPGVVAPSVVTPTSVDAQRAREDVRS